TLERQTGDDLWARAHRETQRRANARSACPLRRQARPEQRRSPRESADRSPVSLGRLHHVAVGTLEDALEGLHRWGRAAVVVIPASVALFVGIVVGAARVSANDD